MKSSGRKPSVRRKSYVRRKSSVRKRKSNSKSKRKKLTRVRQNKRESDNSWVLPAATALAVGLGTAAYYSTRKQKVNERGVGSAVGGVENAFTHSSGECRLIEGQCGRFCGMHAINNLWQEKKITREQFITIARDTPAPEYVIENDGNYTLDLVAKALEWTGAIEVNIVHWHQQNPMKFDPIYDYIVLSTHPLHYVAVKYTRSRWCVIDSVKGVSYYHPDSLVAHFTALRSISAIEVRLREN